VGFFHDGRRSRRRLGIVLKFAWIPFHLQSPVASSMGSAIGVLSL
jgi:hypothetical protein